LNKPKESSSALPVDPWTDALGGLVERYPGLCVRLGNWETRLLGDEVADVAIDRPIYICGLARSGTTILLELLAKHQATVTHRYRDFPLVLAPWTWNWFVERAGRKEAVAQERAHRDRILITRESPEAFEEVVWMAFFPELHATTRSAVLDGSASHPEFEAFYSDHIRKLIRLRGGQRYLTKGNYNVTRIAYLRRLFPNARFVVPVRDPVWHIASLMKQHRLFSSAEAQDERVLRHMRRAGHFEFGLDRRTINAGDTEAAEEVERLWGTGEDVAGWAAHWALVHGHIAKVLEVPELAGAIQVVRYEDLCADPATTLTAVLDHCGLAHDDLPEVAREQISAPNYYEPNFTEAERTTIRSRTEAVAARFGYG
jgi:Sulfotransferase family